MIDRFARSFHSVSEPGGAVVDATATGVLRRTHPHAAYRQRPTQVRAATYHFTSSREVRRTTDPEIRRTATERLCALSSAGLCWANPRGAMWMRFTVSTSLHSPSLCSPLCARNRNRKGPSVQSEGVFQRGLPLSLHRVCISAALLRGALRAPPAAPAAKRGPTRVASQTSKPAGPHSTRAMRSIKAPAVVAPPSSHLQRPRL